MTADLTNRIITQGRALVRAIEPTGPFERALARLLMAAYKRRLRAIVAAAPAWVSEEVLNASERGQAAPPSDFCPELQYTTCA